MLTLNDGRSELWQWDTGRTLAVGADCSQVHFSNKVFGRSIDVDVVDGVAGIPDILLQSDKDLNVWAFAGTADNGYTKISKTFKVNRRNKPADYVFTPTEQTTLAELSGRLDRIEESQDPDAIKNAVDDYLAQNPVEAPVQSVNGQTGAVELNAEDVGAIAETELQTAINTALAQAKASGEFDGDDGKDGADGVGIQSVEQTVTSTEDGGTNVITVTKADGTSSTFEVKNGSKGSTGATGAAGQDGYTPVKGTDYWTAADKQEIIDDIHPAFYIDLAGAFPDYTCPVAMDDINTAYNAGYNLVCRCQLGAYTAALPLFVPMPAANTWIFSGSGTLDTMGFAAQSFTVAITANGVVSQQTMLATAGGRLPNPHSLMITVGDTTYSYNGSETVTVVIDDGTEVSY